MIAREASVCQPTMPLAQGIDIDRPRRAVPAPHVGSDDNEPQQEGFTYMNPQKSFSRINDIIAWKSHIRGHLSGRGDRYMTTGKRWTFLPVGMLAVAAALLASALSLHDTASPASAQAAGGNTVEVGDDHFAPQTITIPVGTTVTWEVAGSHGHTVTSDTGVFSSGTTPLTQGDTFGFTFNQPGTFPYYCLFHGGPGGVGMSGTVVVTAAQSHPTPVPSPTPMPTYAPTPTPMPAAAPTPAPAPSGGAAGSSITVTLGPGRDGSQPGTAMLMAMGSETEVDINITPGAAGVPQPVHIHDGTCDTLGAVQYPLTNIVDGKSTTMVAVPLSSLLTGNFAINVHMSQAEISTYVACGTIPASTTQTAPVTQLPAAGSAGLQGGYSSRGMSTWWYVLLGAGAVLLVSGATVLWKARVRR
jgi:plastocyanin